MQLFGGQAPWLVSTSWSAAWARWEARRFIIWRVEAYACWASSAMRPVTIAAPRMAQRASFVSVISSIPPMSRCCAAPMPCGRNWSRRARSRFFIAPDGGDRCACGHAGAGDARQRPPPWPAPRNARRLRVDAAVSGLWLPADYVGLASPTAAGLPSMRRSAPGSLGGRGRRRDSKRRYRPRHRAAFRCRACPHRRWDCRSRRRHCDRRRMDEIAIARACRPAAGDPRGHGLVRGTRPRIVHKRAIAGLMLESRHGMHYAIRQAARMSPAASRLPSITTAMRSSTLTITTGRFRQRTRR